MHWRALTTQASPRSSRPIGAGCCLADCHSLRRLRPISRLFPSPSVRRQDDQLSQNGRRQREPEGRSPARTRRQGKRSAAAPGRITGGGGRGGVAIERTHQPPSVRAGRLNQPYDATHPTPQHPRQHKPHGARPKSAAAASRNGAPAPQESQVSRRKCFAFSGGKHGCTFFVRRPAPPPIGG